MSVKADRFRPFETILDSPASERKILEFWKEVRAFEEGLRRREGSPPFLFYEGPPTANGLPGVHHVLSRTVKDVVCRYQAMRGRYVARKGGWDTPAFRSRSRWSVSSESAARTRSSNSGSRVQRALPGGVLKYENEWRRNTERSASGSTWTTRTSRSRTTTSRPCGGLRDSGRAPLPRHKIVPTARAAARRSRATR
jgi:isoleucyl-tRNA synthetase